MPVLPGRPGVAVPGSAPIATDAEVAAAVAAHEADSTSVHGITDTAQLVTTTVANATYATLRDEFRREASAQSPRIVTLLSGQQDETPSVVNCTVSADLTNYKIGDRGLKVTIGSATTGQVILDPPGPSDPMHLPPPAVVGAWVYMPDASKVVSMTLEFYTDIGLNTAPRFARTVSSGFVNGWNLLRTSVADGLADYSYLPNVYRVRVNTFTNAATEVTIGHVWAECSPKAQILMISDGAYKTFVDNGLPDLRALGVPVTWAIDVTYLGGGTGKTAIASEAEIEAFHQAGDSISFHSYAGGVTSSMTSTQIAQDTLKCIRWLQQRGYEGRMWRAAWTQNDATNAAAARPFVLAYATPNSTSAQASWPPTDRWNLPRTSVHGRTTSFVDDIFAEMEATNGLFIWYAHGIHSDGGNDATPAEWSYFVSKLQAGIEAGWLEGVTFEDLYARSGGKFKQGFGDPQYEYLDTTGTVIRRNAI